MLDGVNDSPAQARRCSRWCAATAARRAGLPCKVNLIPVQSVPGVGPASARRARASLAFAAGAAAKPASSPRCARRAATTSPPPAASWPARCRTARASSSDGAARAMPCPHRCAAPRAAASAKASRRDAGHDERTRSCAPVCSLSPLGLLLGACVGTDAASPRRLRHRDARTASRRPTSPRRSKRARARMELAAAYFSRARLTTALDQVKLAIAADPNYGEAYNLRGLIYCQPRRPGAGRGELQARAAAQPARRRHDAQLRLVPVPAEALRRSRTRCSRQALAVPQLPRRAATLLAQGVCQAHAGQLAEAEARAGACLRARSDQPGHRRPTWPRCSIGAASTSAPGSTSAASTRSPRSPTRRRCGSRRGSSTSSATGRARPSSARSCAIASRESREAAAFARGRVR